MPKALVFAPYGVGGGADAARVQRPRGQASGQERHFDSPTALGVLPGLGLVVRSEAPISLHILVHPDAVHMASMSCCRVGWMVAVARAVLYRDI